METIASLHYTYKPNVTTILFTTTINQYVMEIVRTLDDPVCANSAGRSEAFLTVAKSIFEALCGNMWADVQDFSKND